MVERGPAPLEPMLRWSVERQPVTGGKEMMSCRLERSMVKNSIAGPGGWVSKWGTLYKSACLPFPGCARGTAYLMIFFCQSCHSFQYLFICSFFVCVYLEEL